MREPKLALGPDLVKLIAEIDEFKGRWEALKMLPPDRLIVEKAVADVSGNSADRHDNSSTEWR